MGYDLHITRADDWCESEENAITLDEWLSYVATDQELHLQTHAEVQTPTGTLSCDNEGLAIWSGTQTGGADPENIWFDYRRGRIVVTNPEEHVIAKMIRVADQLKAKVIGDEGEQYS